MPQVSISIDGKTYRMACGEGEEPHLRALAELLGARIGEMRKAFGEIGDMRLQVMAALTVADELTETRRRLTAAQAEAAEARAEAERAAAAAAEQEAILTARLNRAAEQVEHMVQRLRAPEPREGY